MPLSPCGARFSVQRRTSVRRLESGTPAVWDRRSWRLSSIPDDPPTKKTPTPPAPPQWNGTYAPHAPQRIQSNPALPHVLRFPPATPRGPLSRNRLRPHRVAPAYLPPPPQAHTPPSASMELSGI